MLEQRRIDEINKMARETALGYATLTGQQIAKIVSDLMKEREELQDKVETLETTLASYTENRE